MTSQIETRCDLFQIWDDGSENSVLGPGEVEMAQFAKYLQCTRGGPELGCVPPSSIPVKSEAWGHGLVGEDGERKSPGGFPGPSV